VRVLVVGPAFFDWDLGTYVRLILEKMGATVRTFGYSTAATDVEAQRDLLAECRAFRPQLLFGLKLDRIAPDTLRMIRRSGVRVLLWYVDCFERKAPDWIRERVRECDAVFISAKALVPGYRRIGPAPVYWMMEGAYLPAFPAIAVSAGERRLFGSEVAFVGSVYHPASKRRDFHAREHLLRKVGAKHALKIWGPQRYSGIYDRVASQLTIIPWPAYNRDLVRICRSTKIVLGINFINSLELYFSNRTFLTLAAGGFHLTHYVPGLETMFENHKHLVWFDSEDECLDLITHYLARPKRRRAIAEAGRRLVRNRFSMTRQVRKMLRLMQGHDE
jgi:hypothetical protein